MTHTVKVPTLQGGITLQSVILAPHKEAANCESRFNSPAEMARWIYAQTRQGAMVTIIAIDPSD